MLKVCSSLTKAAKGCSRLLVRSTVRPWCASFQRREMSCIWILVEFQLREIRSSWQQRLSPVHCTHPQRAFTAQHLSGLGPYMHFPMLPVKVELIENAQSNHNLWFRFSLSKAGISYSILKALPNWRSEMKLENKSTARISRFLTKLTWSRCWLPWACCHPFMISRNVRRRKHPSRYWSGDCGVLWLAPEWIPDSPPHCSPACVGKPNHLRAWGNLSCVVCAPCCKEMSVTLSNLENKKKQKNLNRLRLWLALPFRLRSVHIPNQGSQHRLPALFLTASREVTTMLSPNSNHEHNTFPNENVRCPFPLLLVFIPVHTSHTKSPGLSCLDASIISPIKCMSHLTSRKLDAKCMQDFRIFA